MKRRTFTPIGATQQTAMRVIMHADLDRAGVPSASWLWPRRPCAPRWDLRDDREIALFLFELLNAIADQILVQIEGLSPPLHQFASPTASPNPPTSPRLAVIGDDASTASKVRGEARRRGGGTTARAKTNQPSV